MYFDRWDIVEAHYWFTTHYHGGQCSDMYARLSRISNYFSPGMSADGPTSENACIIYNNLETKHGFPETPYEVLPSGEAMLIE
jgi:hypothetical protein